ncbi:hypothetical protein ACNT8L_05905 [Brucella intermedia]|uniref:hypothetical protein n=1 Tax=Brucella intermedia TaxID=94625 RepID=UPI003AB3931F
MAKTTFTPGPWVVENPVGEDVGLTIVQDGLTPGEWTFLALVVTHDNQDGRRISKKEQRANGHLMASAPDLYVALKLFVDQFGEEYIDGPYRSRDLYPGLYAIADKALAKARGEEV